MGAFAVPATVLRLPRGPLGWRRLLVEGRGDYSRRLPWQVLQTQRPPRHPARKPLAVGSGRLRRQGSGLEVAEPSRPTRSLTLSSDQEDEWLPLIGNGGTQCQQMQQGGNGVWCSRTADRRPGGPMWAARRFCNTLVLHHRHPDGRRHLSGAVRPTITDDRRTSTRRRRKTYGRSRASARSARRSFSAASVLRGERRAVRVAAAENRRRRAEDGGEGRGGVLRAGPRRVPEEGRRVGLRHRERPQRADLRRVRPDKPVLHARRRCRRRWCQRNCDDDYCPRSHCRALEAQSGAVGDRTKLPPRLRQRLRRVPALADAGQSSRPWRTASTSACVRRAALRLRERQYVLPPVLRQVGAFVRGWGHDQSLNLGSL